MSPRNSAAAAAGTRTAILDRAVEVASTQGLEGLTIGRLAADVRMSKAGVISLRRILRFAAIVEVGTGLALLIDPRLVVGLLIGARAPPDEIPLGRLPRSSAERPGSSSTPYP